MVAHAADMSAVHLDGRFRLAIAIAIAIAISQILPTPDASSRHRDLSPRSVSGPTSPGGADTAPCR